MSLKELIVRLTIEEDNRKVERKIWCSIWASKDKHSGIRFENQQKEKTIRWWPKRDNNKSDKKFKGNSCKCTKTGNHASEYCKPKKNTQANMIERDTLFKEIQKMSLSTIVFKFINIENSREWWIDVDVTHYICADKAMFLNYKEFNWEQIFNGNSASL